MKLRACLALVVCVCLAAGPAWTDTAEVAATNANLRSAPGTSSPVVATLVRGARLEVLDVSGDWLKVRVVETKAVGWVHRRLVGTLPSTGGPAPASAAPRPTAPVAAPADSRQRPDPRRLRRFPAERDRHRPRPPMTPSGRM